MNMIMLYIYACMLIMHVIVHEYDYAIYIYACMLIMHVIVHEYDYAIYICMHAYNARHCA